MPKGVYQRDPNSAIYNRWVWTPERDQTVREAYLSGQSMKEIATALGTTRNRVAESLARTGTTSRGKGNPGEKNPAWKGGRRYDADGYVLIYKPEHPEARINGCVLEHRLVVESVIGRTLLPSEVVHHKNGIKDDNRPENLQLFQSNAEHLAFELSGRVPNWTLEGKAKLNAIARAKHEAAIARNERPN